MTSPRSLPLASLAVLGAAALLLTGCSGSAEPDPTATVGTTAPSGAPTDAAPQPSASADAAPVDATCESILDADTVAQFGAQNWTYKETPFAAGGVTLDDGLQCTWADYDVPSGNLMIFGWAPITADQAAQMQQGLEAEGWLSEDDGTNSYITEDPMQAPTVDDNGYGMTYQFGDGWVTVADVKQNLLLIQLPQG